MIRFLKIKNFQKDLVFNYQYDVSFLNKYIENPEPKVLDPKYQGNDTFFFKNTFEKK